MVGLERPVFGRDGRSFDQRQQVALDALAADRPAADVADGDLVDFVRILSSTRASLTEQYQALLGTEGVRIDFADDGIEALARIAAEVNEAVENIGARRLQTVMEKLLEDVSFEAEDRTGETLVVDAAFVEQQLSGIAKNADLSRYVL
jgi:ATP-dependent HslUV protease ATP-binding subunit HslU